MNVSEGSPLGDGSCWKGENGGGEDLLASLPLGSQLQVYNQLRRAPLDWAVSPIKGYEGPLTPCLSRFNIYAPALTAALGHQRLSTYVYCICTRSVSISSSL